MDSLTLFKASFGACPLVAIIRGVEPEEVEAIGGAIFDAGIRIIEVPLNSPRPLDSIGRLATKFGDRALIGAGTVLSPAAVADVAGAGGRIIVSPGTCRATIEATVAAGLVSSPGYFTPTEAFAALAAGAHVLKLFPAEGASPAVVAAHRAVLPHEVTLIVVGGITLDKMAAYRDAGASGFALGGALYRRGQGPGVVGTQARAFVESIR